MQNKSSRLSLVFRQLLKEFWLPLMAAISWTCYSIYAGKAKFDEPATLVPVFGSALFFTSWLLAQYFRVNKQVAVETSFTSLENRFDGLITKIEIENKQITDRITGGDSFAYLQVGSIDHQRNTGIFVLVHSGDYVLFDINVKVVDVNKFKIQPPSTIQQYQNLQFTEELSALMPTYAVALRNVQLDPSGKQAFNVFLVARNGGFAQEIRMEKINGVWKRASRLTKSDSGVEIHREVEQSFPLMNGEVAW